MLVGVALAMLLGLALRLVHLDRQSLWLDELLSLEASAARGQTDQALPTGQWITPAALTRIDPETTIADVGRNLAADSHPPGFYMALRLWRQVAGEGTWALRLLTVLLSTAGIGAVGWLAWEVELSLRSQVAGGPGPAPPASISLPVVAALLAAVSTPQIYFAQELRMYAALPLVTASAAAMAVRALRHRHEWHDDMALFTGAGLVAMFTHYAAALTLGIMLGVMATRRHLRWGVPAAIIVGAAIYWFAWGDALMAQRAALEINRAVAARGEAANPNLAIFAGATVWLTQLWGAAPWGRAASVPWADVSAGLIFILASVLLVWRTRQMAVLAVVLWANAGWVIIAIGGGGAVAMMRYQLVVAPAIFVVLALLARLTRWPGWVGAAVTAAIVASPSHGPYGVFKPDWKGFMVAIEAAEAQGGAREPIILWSLLPDNRYLLGGSLLGLSHYGEGGGREYLLLDGSYRGPIRPTGWLINLTPQYGPPALELASTAPLPNAPAALPFTIEHFTAAQPTLRPWPTTAESPTPAK